MSTAAHVRIASLLVALLLALPIPFSPFTGFYLWTSPFIMLNTVLAGGGFRLLHILAILVLISAVFRRRWYCHWLCPAGVLCEFASGISRLRIKSAKIPRLNKPLVIAAMVLSLAGVPLLSVLDPIALFHAFFDGLRRQPAFAAAAKLSGLLLLITISFAIPHLWCSRLCPLGGMQDILNSMQNFWRRTAPTSAYPSGRRLALGMLFGFGLKWSLAQIPIPANRTIRPPGALREDRFKEVCIRCGNCAKACPTDIIGSSFDAHDLAGLLSPAVDFDKGYCLPRCTACGDVCPSAAIGKFSTADKHRLFMATVLLHREACLLSVHKECDLCHRYCEYDAVVIHNATGGVQAWPEIMTNRCVGCAACALVCPPRAITMIALA